MTRKKILEITDLLSDCQFELQMMIQEEDFKYDKSGAKETLAEVRKKRTELFNLISESK